MADAKKLILEEADGSLSFGNHKLDTKAKLEDFKYKGDLLKVKTYKTMTKLEKNGLFVYESVPGTTVSHFVESPDGLSFRVNGDEDAQITVGLEDNQAYLVTVDGEEAGAVQANMSGKVDFSVELSGNQGVQVEVRKV